MSSGKTWIFERDERTPAGLVRAERPSTDAHSVLPRWESPSLGRTVEVVYEDDDVVHAALARSEKDTHAVDALDQLCRQYGVKRHPLEK